MNGMKLTDTLGKIKQNGNHAAKLLPELLDNLVDSESKVFGNPFVLFVQLDGVGSFDDTPSTGTGKVTFSGSGSGDDAIKSYADQMIDALCEFLAEERTESTTLMGLIKEAHTYNALTFIVVSAKAKGLNTTTDEYYFCEPVNVGGKVSATSGICSTSHIVIA